MQVVPVLVLGTLFVAGLTIIPQSSMAGNPPIILTVGDKAEMLSRNVLRGPLGPYSSDEWTTGILSPVYSNLLISDPTTTALRPYIAKGIDADGNGVFDSAEYGTFAKKTGTNATDMTVYLDFNGIVWHDGAQMNVMDFMFSLRAASLWPWNSALYSALWNSTSGDIGVEFAPKTWSGEGSLPGDAGLRNAVRFRLQHPYARFYEAVFAQMPMVPRHVWELTGGGRHPDWGRLIYPEGDPRAGHWIPANETVYTPFVYIAAFVWEPSDSDVIGSGPFRFTTWFRGAYVWLDRYDSYFIGTDPARPAVVYDGRLAAVLHRPIIERIVFKVYRTEQIGVIALANGEIQYYRASIAPEYVPDLLNNLDIRVWANLNLGFSYIGFNMRRVPFGYSRFPPADSVRDDTGLPFRLAFAHLVDKRSLVNYWFQNFGVPADGPVSPANLLWYNDTLPRIPYDLAEAARILDAAGWTDPPGPCLADGTGCRNLPGIGTRAIEILAPPRDYDRTVAGAGSLFVPAARTIGLNVVLQPMAFMGFPNPISDGQYDMFLSSWVIRNPDPEFLYPLYDCRNVSPWGGQNYLGYCDGEFDSLIERAGVEMNGTERQRLMKWAQGILMSDRPMEPLAFTTSIQATRQDSFVNWTVGAGSLWNYWSWIGLKPPLTTRALAVTVRYTTSMVSGGRQRIEVAVRDLKGNAVAGATVTMRVLPQDGGIFVESASPMVNVTTGAIGTFAATYESPLVLGSLRDIAIEVIANDPTAPSPVQRGVVVTVFPGAVRFLSLRVSWPAGDIALPDTSLPLRVEVSDESEIAVPDAAVTAAVSPANATLTRMNGSSSEMASLGFSPPRDLRSTMSYRISIVATKPRYYSAFANASVLVVYRPDVSGPPPTALPPQLEPPLVALLAGAAATGALALLWAMVRIRRRGGPKK